jgi:maltoporin
MKSKSLPVANLGSKPWVSGRGRHAPRKSGEACHNPEWSQEEDERLIYLCYRHVYNWDTITEELQKAGFTLYPRSRNACRSRAYKLGLDIDTFEKREAFIPLETLSEIEIFALCKPWR